MVDTRTLRASLSELERQLETAREAKYQIEGDFAKRRHKGSFWADAAAAFPAILNNLQETLLIVLEASALIHTRQRLLDKWSYFEAQGGIGNTQFQAEYDYLESKPFDYLEKQVEAIRIIAGEGMDPGDAHELATLERMLRKTPMLLHRRKIQPKNEKDVRDVMHDYLEAAFTNVRSQFPA
jgi:hypothetical protein